VRAIDAVGQQQQLAHRYPLDHEASSQSGDLQGGVHLLCHQRGCSSSLLVCEGVFGPHCAAIAYSKYPFTFLHSEHYSERRCLLTSGPFWALPFQVPAFNLSDARTPRLLPLATCSARTIVDSQLTSPMRLSAPQSS